MHAHKLTNAKQVKTFILAGKATFTLVSKKTGARFTYRARQKEKDGRKTPHFISLLNGPDNTSSYVFFGSIFNESQYSHGRRTVITQDAPSVKAFVWLWNQLSQNTLPETVEFWHEGKCCRCGRPLTVPSSIESGIGPECIKKVRH